VVRTKPFLSVVTGGSSGIGRAITSAFRARGDEVVVLDSQPPEEVRERWLETNVGDEKEVEHAFGVIGDKYGPLSVLVNCAGVDLGKTLIDTTLEDWERVNRINATGTFLCTRAAAKSMIPQRAGSIVSVSSINAHLGWRNRSAYSASKGAIEAFTRAVAAELGPLGIRVNAVAPGSIATPIWGGTLTPDARRIHGERAALGRLGDPEDIAGAVAFLTSDASCYVSGVVLQVDGGRSTIDYLPTDPPRATE
jgi:NAD(P)-dependent dehydrogenase (short-subunit alcohol dehydrogenase family)